MKNELKQKSYFCGATLFNILVETKANTNKKNNKELSNSQILFGLAKIFNNIEHASFSGNSAAQQTSKYRSGAAGVPTFMGMDDPQLVEKFIKCVENNRAGYIEQVESFIDDFLNIEDEDPWLVSAIFDVIANDESIAPSEIMYIELDGKRVTKQGLDDVLQVHIPSMLLGVWCFALKRKDDRVKVKDFYKSFTIKDRSNNNILVRSNFGWDSIDIIDTTTIDYIEEHLDDVSHTNSGLTPIRPEDVVNGAENFLMEFAKALQRFKGEYSTYIAKLYADRKECRTFIYKIRKPFKDFYVCNDVKRRISNLECFVNEEKKKLSEPISDVTINKFASNAIMLIGSGGLGKSMMLNHLLLDEINHFEKRKRVPIIFEIRRYKAIEVDSLFGYLVNEMTKYDPNLTADNLTDLLKDGKAIMLLDGYDEIQDEYKESFKNDVERLVLQYPKSYIVISSRKTKQLHILDKFISFDLCPLDLQQAFSMIRKIDSPEFSEDLKERFINDIKNNRFNFNRDEKQEFLGNPLLLTIMLTTYAETNDIKTKRYLFYEDAYTVLAQRHDADKGITRAFRTGLDIRDFKIKFGEFCALAFYKQEYEFKEKDFEDYLQTIIDLNDLKATVADFISDITEKLCLMYLDGNVYRWVHRSFQEYFAAFFFSLQLAQDFTSIYQVFTSHDESLQDDETLSMLFGLNERLTESCIIMPYIEERFIKGRDPKDISSYETFLRGYYPIIYYATGDLEPEYDNITDFALYNFIVDKYNLSEYITEMDFDGGTGYATKVEEYYYIYKNWRDETSGSYVLVRDFEVPTEYNLCHEPSEAGATCSLIIEEILKRREMEDELEGKRANSGTLIMQHLDSDVFPLKKEYNGVINLYYELKEKYSQIEKKSFLSNFH